jgi:hypothetical protein
MGGCSYSPVGVWMCVEGAGGSCFGGLGNQTGATCTGDDRPVTDAEKSCYDKSQCTGYVNGVATCVPCSSTTDNKKTEQPPASNPYSESKSERTTTNPDGTTTKTEKTYRYNPDGSVTVDTKATTTHADGSQSVANSTNTIAPGSVKIPTTTTTNTDRVNPDGTVTRSTTTNQTFPDGSNTTTNKNTTNSGQSFCKENPESPICKKSQFHGGVGGLVCDVAPGCDGDAVQCAAAEAQWADYCQDKKLADEISGTNPYKELANESVPGGNQVDIDRAANKTGAFDLNVFTSFQANRQNYIQWASACVPSAGFDFKGQHYEFDLSIICQMGDFVRLMLHVIAYMAVLRMFTSSA